ncbi:unnamed protein product, partial [Schistocephalus solidus]|uniref:S ribonuclease n=1 Tax=Schistocephalus solidus TaxID=70667 RepID=A0A183TQA2_SCHSO
MKNGANQEDLDSSTVLDMDLEHVDVESKMIFEQLLKDIEAAFPAARAPSSEGNRILHELVTSVRRKLNETWTGYLIMDLQNDDICEEASHAYHKLERLMSEVKQWESQYTNKKIYHAHGEYHSSSEELSTSSYSESSQVDKRYSEYRNGLKPLESHHAAYRTTALTNRS